MPHVLISLDDAARSWDCSAHNHYWNAYVRLCCPFAASRMTLNKHLIELSERQSGFVQAPELAERGIVTETHSIEADLLH